MISVCIVGATGYTGAELMRLLAQLFIINVQGRDYYAYFGRPKTGPAYHFEKN